MSTIYIRHESALNNFFTRPFEVGVRHLKLGFCDGKQETLTNLAKERIIYRSSESTNSYKPLTLASRAYHITLGILETLGYLTIIVPFILAIADSLFARPPCKWDKSPAMMEHQREGGIGGYEILGTEAHRHNPFPSSNEPDNFYAMASWVIQPKVQAFVLDRDHARGIENDIQTVLRNPLFQRNPQQFMADWRQARGATEEFRIEEDSALLFFKRELHL